MKKNIKISFNTTEEIEKELKQIIDNSDDFGINKTVIINKALKCYIKNIKGK